MFWIGFIVGIFVGSYFGIIVLGLLTAAREADEKMEKWRNGE